MPRLLIRSVFTRMRASDACTIAGSTPRLVRRSIITAWRASDCSCAMSRIDETFRPRYSNCPDSSVAPVTTRKPSMALACTRPVSPAMAAAESLSVAGTRSTRN
ncbi:MAG TPA: hypothetical protein DEP35_21340 [Deltaproteobacteria bacterium]|nr:hypothetical protein [Deltaproteobacteria bacterium]